MLKRIVLAVIFVFVCVWSLPASAACAGGTCFVVAAGGNSNATTTWTTSSGGTTCTCTPATTDAVILDSAAGQLTINAALSIGSLDASGAGGSGSPYANTLTQASASALTINTAATNSLKFSTQMTYSPNANTGTTVTFANTSGTAQITSSGKNFTAIIMNGVGGTAQQLDDINITAGTGYSGQGLTVTNGVWDANAHAITAATVASNNSNTRSVILGGLVKIGGANIAVGTSLWNFATTGTLTFTKNSANIEVVAPTNAISGIAFTGAGLTYNALTLDSNTSGYSINIVGANSFSTVTVGAGWLVWIPAAATQTLSGALTINGTAAHPSSIMPLSASGIATISAVGTCAATWTAIYGITGTGGCVFTATNSFGIGSSTGWTFVGSGVSAPGDVSVH